MWSNICKRCLRLTSKPVNISNCQTRNYPAPPKRFYLKTDILKSNGQYEILLDQRKLKTPKGNVFKVDNEALALAVAAEWDAQKDKIMQSNMHLSALCSTVIDNPSNTSKFDLAQKVISYLDTDTILFQSSTEEELARLQENEWNTVIDWFCKTYNVDIRPTKDISPPHMSQEIKHAVQRHLQSYNFQAVNGFAYAVESLKSVILTFACVNRYLSVEKSVILSRLEEEYQTGHWGRVEWAHDLSQMDLQARVAAAVLFIHLNSSSQQVKWKHQVSNR